MTHDDRPRAVGESAHEQRVVLVSGLSGAGKASILRALEDLGFEAVDNPPLPMLRDLVARTALAGGRRMAIGVDARTSGFDADAVLGALSSFRSDRRLRPELVFAWADDAVLQRRFSETRRRHPLAESGRVQDGIDAERILTAELREAADLVIDTSALPLAELRQLIAARYAPGARTTDTGLAITLISFAFPAGLPRESDMVMDVRFLRNPHYVAALRSFTGLDEAVGNYVKADADFESFYGRLGDLLELLLPRFVVEGKKYFTVSIGCTGGRHRSVYVVSLLADDLAAKGWPVRVLHRELDRPGLTAGVAAPMSGRRARDTRPVASLSAESLGA